MQFARISSSLYFSVVNVRQIFLNISKELPAYVPPNQAYNSLKLKAKKNEKSGGCC
jgi:hypothetical protein